MCTYESLCSMPWVRSAIDNVSKRLWAANAYDQLFTLKIVGEDPGRCKVLEDILSSVHQRRGEVWRIASARSNSRPLNAPQELLQPSQVRGQKTVFFCILRALPHKNCCNLLKFVATLGRLVTETEMLLPKGKSFESVLQNSNPTKRKYPVRFISGGKYVKC